MLTPKKVRSITPAYGLHTRYLSDVLASLATQDIPRGTPITWELVRPS
ncbi:MAG: SAF domain-containing protein [Candidatus Latescibacterota bacterium]|nr:SAF domain-containing protein [Candidatus Latescibacterota bacterium]